MGDLTVLGFDGGFKETGWAVLRFFPSMAGIESPPEIVDAGVITTEKSDRKKKIAEADDLTRRIREIANPVRKILDLWSPRIVCIESFSFIRNASAAAKCAAGYAAIIALIPPSTPIAQCTPQDVHKLTGIGKRATANYVTAHAGDAGTIDERVQPAGLAVHAFDAAAVVLTLRDSEIMRAVRGAL